MGSRVYTSLIPLGINRLIKNQFIDSSLIADDEEFTVMIDSKRAWLFGNLTNHSNIDEFAILLCHRPDRLRFKISKDIFTHIRRAAASTVNISTCNRNAMLAAIRDYWWAK